MTASRRFVLAAVVLPAAIATVAVLIAWSWRDQLPDPVATHWGSDGVDGFTARTPAILMSGMGLPIGLLVGGLVAYGGCDKGNRRLGAAVSAGMTTLISVLAVGGLSLQRGLADPRAVGSIGLPLLVAFASALVVGAGAAWCVGPHPRRPGPR